MTNVYSYLIAPLVAFFFIGWAFSNYHALGFVAKYHGFITSGLLRALGELCLGAFCVTVASRIGRVPFTPFGRICLHMVELAGYIGVIVGTCFFPGGEKDFLYLAALAASVTISFSEQTSSYFQLNTTCCKWLRNMSLGIYLTHVTCRSIVNFTIASFGFWHKLSVYILLCIAMSVGVILILPILKRLLHKVSRLFIAGT